MQTSDQGIANTPPAVQDSRRTERKLVSFLQTGPCEDIFLIANSLESCYGNVPPLM